MKTLGIESFPDDSGMMDHFMVLENRRGNEATRRRNEEVRDWFLRNNPGWRHIRGGRDQETGSEIKEFWFRGPAAHLGNPRAGSAYADLTFESPDGSARVHINTVDADEFGNPTLREVRNAEKMKRLSLTSDGGGDTVLLIPKYQSLR